MKRYFLVSILLSVVVCATALGQEPAPERQIELRRMQLELEEQEAELNFQRQMHELKLEQRRMELERQHKNQKNGGAVVILLLCLLVTVSRCWSRAVVVGRGLLMFALVRRRRRSLVGGRCWLWFVGFGVCPSG